MSGLTFLVGGAGLLWRRQNLFSSSREYLQLVVSAYVVLLVFLYVSSFPCFID